MRQHNADLNYLSAVSPKDKRWDSMKKSADQIARLYSQLEVYQYSDRICSCAQDLEFSSEAKDNGILSLFLRSAHFCRVRLCPICQWRRSLMWLAKTTQALPTILDEYPNAQFIYLTLTVKNCPVTELRKQLNIMNRAWAKLIKRKQFKALGWLRVTEVTRDKDDYAHPHFHVLLTVNKSYFTGQYYLSQKRWIELWQSCLGVDYNPIVDVRKVTEKRYAHNSKDLSQDNQSSYAHSSKHVQQGLIDAVNYTLKYGTKSTALKKSGQPKNTKQDMLDDSDKSWLLELTHQLHKTRFIATGGIMKEHLKDLEAERQDLIHSNPDEIFPPRTGDEFLASWNDRVERYVIH